MEQITGIMNAYDIVNFKESFIITGDRENPPGMQQAASSFQPGLLMTVVTLPPSGRALSLQPNDAQQLGVLEKNSTARK